MASRYKPKVGDRVIVNQPIAAYTEVPQGAMGTVCKVISSKQALARFPYVVLIDGLDNPRYESLDHPRAYVFKAFELSPAPTASLIRAYEKME